jgi:hypothetical protein
MVGLIHTTSEGVSTFMLRHKDHGIVKRTWQEQVQIRIRKGLSLTSQTKTSAVFEDGSSLDIVQENKMSQIPDLFSNEPLTGRIEMNQKVLAYLVVSKDARRRMLVFITVTSNKIGPNKPTERCFSLYGRQNVNSVHIAICKCMEMGLKSMILLSANETFRDNTPKSVLIDGEKPWHFGISKPKSAPVLAVQMIISQAIHGGN